MRYLESRRLKRRFARLVEAQRLYQSDVQLWQEWESLRQDRPLIWITGIRAVTTTGTKGWMRIYQTGEHVAFWCRGSSVPTNMWVSLTYMSSRLSPSQRFESGQDEEFRRIILGRCTPDATRQGWERVEQSRTISAQAQTERMQTSRRFAQCLATTPISAETWPNLKADFRLAPNEITVLHSSVKIDSWDDNVNGQNIDAFMTITTQRVTFRTDQGHRHWFYDSIVDLALTSPTELMLIGPGRGIGNESICAYSRTTPRPFLSCGRSAKIHTIPHF